MCSPSRSQSVQMKRPLARFASFSILVAMSCFSFTRAVSRFGGGHLIWRSTHSINFNPHWGPEQAFGWRILPVLFVLGIELGLCQMPRDASHHYITVPPWRTKVKCKGIVLDELVGCICLEGNSVGDQSTPSPAR